jgi:hypothetical protein
MHLHKIFYKVVPVFGTTFKPVFCFTFYQLAPKKVVYIYMKMSKLSKSLWRNQKPSYHQRTVMFKQCGKKCFLGPRKSFPICRKNTCKISKEGLMAAYKRARQYTSISRKRGKSNKYSQIAKKAFTQYKM